MTNCHHSATFEMADPRRTYTVNGFWGGQDCPLAPPQAGREAAADAYLDPHRTQALAGCEAGLPHGRGWLRSGRDRPGRTATLSDDPETPVGPPGADGRYREARRYVRGYPGPDPHLGGENGGQPSPAPFWSAIGPATLPETDRSSYLPTRVPGEVPMSARTWESQPGPIFFSVGGRQATQGRQDAAARPVTPADAQTLEATPHASTTGWNHVTCSAPANWLAESSAGNLKIQTAPSGSSGADRGAEGQLGPLGTRGSQQDPIVPTGGAQQATQGRQNNATQPVTPANARVAQALFHAGGAVWDRGERSASASWAAENSAGFSNMQTAPSACGGADGGADRRLGPYGAKRSLEPFGAGAPDRAAHGAAAGPPAGSSEGKFSLTGVPSDARGAGWRGGVPLEPPTSTPAGRYSIGRGIRWWQDPPASAPAVPGRWLPGLARTSEEVPLTPADCLDKSLKQFLGKISEVVCPCLLLRLRVCDWPKVIQLTSCPRQA